MNSLMSGPHVEQVTAPVFNDAFYAAVVTVIPVLFLAIAVQGNLYTDVLKLMTAAAWRMAESDKRLGKITSNLAFMAGFGLIMIILLYGVVGEIWGLLSLYWRRPPGGLYAVNPAAAAVILTVVAAGGPLVALVRWQRDIPGYYFRGSIHLSVAIVVYEARVLLIWDLAELAHGYGEIKPELFFPHGKVEPGETAEAAAVRGTFEQTGLTVTPSRVLGARPFGPYTVITYVACDRISGIDRAVVVPRQRSNQTRWDIDWSGNMKTLEGVKWRDFQPVIDYLDTMMPARPGKA